MAYSGGSIAFFAISFLLVAILVLLLLRRYLQLRKSPAYFLLPIFLGLALPISIILLVPIDLASATDVTEKSPHRIRLPEGLLHVAWRLLYWLTFALTWAILPLLGEYVDSGYRLPRDRFFYSLRSNGRYYLIVFACAGLAGIYVFLVNGFKTTSLKALVMALAYCFGLVMAIYLMGHGLVAIPRQLIRNANPTKRLRRVQAEAVKTNDKLGDATVELQELEAQLTQLRRRKNAVSRDHEEWIEELSDFPEIKDYRESSTPSTASSPPLPAVLTDRYLAEFSRKLMRTRHKKIRYLGAWQAIIVKDLHLQAVVDSYSSKRIERRENPSAWVETVLPLTPRSRFLLHTKLIPLTRLLFGGILTAASICIIFSELIKSVNPRISVITLTVKTGRFSGYDGFSFANQLTGSLWLLYMSFATLASISSVRVWGNRALIPRHTYPESAAWYASQIAKLTIPLAYNFLTLLPKSSRESTIFYSVLGRSIDLTPLGSWFDQLFPLFILVPIAAALFNIYGRTTRLFGSGFIDDDETGGSSSGSTSALGTGGWREGRDLINRDLQARARAGLSNHLSSAPDTSNDTNNPASTDSRVREGRERYTPPPARSTTTAGQPPPLPRSNTGERQAQRLHAATTAAEEEDESVFQGFAHRVRNTFDGFERPKWMDELGKKPKWMAGSGDDGEGGAGGSTSAGEGRGGGTAFGRLFGGSGGEGAREGGIRL